jgi:gamma-tubulin complex component 2
LVSQLEHAFNTSPQFTLIQLWFYLHPTARTLYLLYQLILEFDADTLSEWLSQSSPSSASDTEEHAREMALGLGGAQFKALLSMMERDDRTAGTETDIAVKGGEVLAIIYERMQHMSGNPTAHTLYCTLLRASEAPYAAMIRAWMTSGQLVDPYDEFCVKESKFINRDTLEMDYTDEYWEERYTVSYIHTCSRSSRDNA